MEEGHRIQRSNGEREDATVLAAVVSIKLGPKQLAALKGIGLSYFKKTNLTFLMAKLAVSVDPEIGSYQGTSEDAKNSIIVNPGSRRRHTYMV